MAKTKMMAAILTAAGSLVAGTMALAQEANARPRDVKTGKTTSVDSVAAPSSLEPLSKLLQEIYQQVRTTENDQLRDLWLLIAIAKAQASLGERDAARVTLGYAVNVADALEPKRAVNGLIAIAYAHWNAGERAAIPGILGHAHQAADTIEGNTYEKVGVLAAIGTAEAWTGDEAAARQTGRTMRLVIETFNRNNDRFQGLLQVVELQVKSGDYEAALHVAEASTSDYEKDALWGRIAEAASHANNYFLQPRRELTEAQRTERREVLHRILKVCRNPSYQVAIALGDLGETDEALRMAHARAKGQTPGGPGDPTAMPWVLTRIAISQAKFGHPDAAKKTLEEALDLIRHHPEMIDSLEQVAIGQARSGDVEEALKTIDSMPPTRRSRILMEIAGVQADHGDQAKATKMFRLALDDARLCLTQPPHGKPGTVGANPEYWKTNSLVTIATCQAKLGEYNPALATAKEIPSNRKGQALSEIAKEQARSGRVEEVMAWAKQLNQSGDRVWALRGLAEGITLRKADDRPSPR